MKELILVDLDYIGMILYLLIKYYMIWKVLQEWAEEKWVKLEEYKLRKYKYIPFSPYISYIWVYVDDEEEYIMSIEE